MKELILVVKYLTCYTCGEGLVSSSPSGVMSHISSPVSLTYVRRPVYLLAPSSRHFFYELRRT